MKFLQGPYQKVLKNETADLIFTSPPYNIGSRSERKDGQRKYGKFDAKSFAAVTGYPDKLTPEEYQDSQEQFLLWAAGHLRTGGTLVYNHKPHRHDRVLVHPAFWFLRPAVQERLTLMDEVVWDRGSTHHHGRHLLWPTTERLYVFRRAGETYALDNTAAIPQRSDLWKILRARGEAGVHCAPFPEKLADAVVLTWSKPGQTVMDPYTGSGTTGVSALRLGREFVGAEREKEYYQAASERISAALST